MLWISKRNKKKYPKSELRYRVISYLCSDTRADESKMSVSFQVRKNTTPFPRGKNQIVMVLFLIWLLRWANLFMCRLPPSLQTFQPTLFGAHTVGTGAWLAVALPWGLCLKLRVDNASSSCPTRTTPSGHTPFLVPSASGLPGQRSMFLTVTGTNTLKCARSGELDPETTVIPWEPAGSRMPGGFGSFTEEVTHQSHWKCNTWSRYLSEMDLEAYLLQVLERCKFLLFFRKPLILQALFKTMLPT